MKSLLTLATVATITLVACKKESVAPVVTPTSASTSIDTTLYSGAFATNAHTTTGTVKLISSKNVRSLKFENFKTDAGPDLRVYLSKAANGTAKVELGTLKATSGNFEYAVASTINVAEYKYVIIWCEDYSVLFGNAPLK